MSELKTKIENYYFLTQQIKQMSDEAEELKQEILLHPEMPQHQLDIGNFIATRSVCRKPISIEYAEELNAITYKKTVDTKAIKKLIENGYQINFELYDKLLIKEKEQII